MKKITSIKIILTILFALILVGCTQSPAGITTPLSTSSTSRPVIKIDTSPVAKSELAPKDVAELAFNLSGQVIGPVGEIPHFERDGCPVFGQIRVRDHRFCKDGGQTSGKGGALRHQLQIDVPLCVTPLRTEPADQGCEPAHPQAWIELCRAGHGSGNGIRLRIRSRAFFFLTAAEERKNEDRTKQETEPSICHAHDSLPSPFSG